MDASSTIFLLFALLPTLFSFSVLNSGMLRFFVLPRSCSCHLFLFSKYVLVRHLFVLCLISEFHLFHLFTNFRSCCLLGWRVCCALAFDLPTLINSRFFLVFLCCRLWPHDLYVSPGWRIRTGTGKVSPIIAAKTCLNKCLRALSQQGLVLNAVSSLTCLICVRQRPCARKGAISQFLRAKITTLDAKPIKTWLGATSGEPSSGQQDPPVLHCPRNKKCGTDSSHMSCIAHQTKNAARTILTSNTIIIF